MTQDRKKQLLDYLEQHAFGPVLRARTQDYPEDQHDKLRGLKQAVEGEVKRFQDAESAEEVYLKFRRSLHSGASREMRRELRALELPTLDEVREGFDDLAGDLGAR